MSDESPARAVLASATLLLLASMAVPGVLASGEEDEGGEEAEDGGFLAVLAAVSLGATGLLVPLNLLNRRVVLPALRGNAVALRRVHSWTRRIILPLHAVAGLVAFVAGAAHGATAERSSPLLWAGVSLLGILVVGGALLRRRWVPGGVRRGAYLLHSQQFLFAVLLAVLLLGHALVED